MLQLRIVFNRLVARYRAWRVADLVARGPQEVTWLTDMQPCLAREVSRHGVRFFSLCADCGCRLEVSATLCGSCAHRRLGQSIRRV
jgi:hypothetical protein